MSSIFTCPDLIAFHLSHVFTSGILHDYLLNDYRISSQGENVSINQWHINSRCIFYVGYISPVKVIILNYLVILSRTICLAIILNIYYTVLMLMFCLSPHHRAANSRGLFLYYNVFIHKNQLLIILYYILPFFHKLFYIILKYFTSNFI